MLVTSQLVTKNNKHRGLFETLGVSLLKNLTKSVIS